MYHKLNILGVFVSVILASGMISGCATSGNNLSSQNVNPAEKELVEFFPNTDMNYIFAEDPTKQQNWNTKQDVIAALNANPALETSGIVVVCTNGVVTLRGGVDSQLQRLIAAKITSNVSGVKEVRNLILAQS